MDWAAENGHNKGLKIQLAVGVVSDLFSLCLAQKPFFAVSLTQPHMACGVFSSVWLSVSNIRVEYLTGMLFTFLTRSLHEAAQVCSRERAERLS